MMAKVNWQGKPYYSLDAWCKNTYQHKCYKVALNAHMTCPNRDGSLDTRGCIFCSAGGSGDFAVGLSPLKSGPQSSCGLQKQLQEGLALIRSKLTLHHDHTTGYVIAYFQAYTNTYAPLSYLEQVYTEALESSEVCGISIATRPDCLPDEVLDLLNTLQKRYSPKFIWIELGLQTIHETTAAYIRRGYSLPCFEDAMAKLAKAQIPVIIHVILGLPGETKEQMLQTVDYLNRFVPFGIKLQLLHVLEGTDLAVDYRQGKFEALTKAEYLDILINCIEHLSPDIVIHRVTGDGPKRLLIAPEWSADKRDVLNSLHTKMKEQGSYQGRTYATRSADTL